MIAPLKLLDRQLWLIPTATAVLGSAAFYVAASTGSWPGIAALTEGARAALMASLAGTAGGLLGLSLAAVSILIAVPKATKAAIGAARRRIAAALLAESTLLALVLVMATYLIVLPAMTWMSALLLGCLAGSLAGLVVVGAAFALAIIEQTRNG